MPDLFPLMAFWLAIGSAVTAWYMLTPLADADGKRHAGVPRSWTTKESCA